MARPTFRVHLVTHHDERITGRLLPSSGRVDDPPTGYGESVDQVLAQLALAIEEKRDALSSYLWDREVQMRRVRVSVHPQSVVKKRHVIGKEEISVQIAMATAKLEEGGWLVMVPQFSWWFVLEDLDMAPGVIRQAVSTELLGQAGGSLYGFRTAADERVIEWSPALPSGMRQSRAEAESGDTPTLHAVAEEWVAAAKRRRGRPIVGGVDLLPQLPLVLRETPRSLLLVGSSGAGKTTWVRALARHLSRVDRNEHPYVPRIWATGADRIVAGMAYLGQWEQRCLDLVDELSDEGDLLYVGELAAIARARSARTSIADMLLPAVHAGEISLIAECDPATFERMGASHPGLVGSFHTVRIDEPSPSQMPAMLDEYQRRVMRGLQLSGEALQRVVSHLDLFARDTGFPGKGIRFVDWLASEQGVTRVGDPAQGEDEEVRELSADEGSEAFARASGLPIEIVSDAYAAGLDTVTQRLRAGVVGQDGACRVAARVITRLKAGLNDPQRPVGSLFFVGPTGVGKTELAKQLARYLFGDADRMVRLDMSEYMLPWSASRLLAVGRGVTSLVERVRQRPLSVVLLDEIEKADPAVFDLLLAMLGEGRMTDMEGRLVDFSMTLVVMTSNLGIRAGAAPGFGSGRDDEEGLVGEVRKHFRPEFFNRIDHVVPFSNLTPEDLAKVVELELTKAARREGLVRRKLRLKVTDEAKTLLAELGYHPSRGARPLKRVIEERIMAPLAVRLAADRRLSDATIVVSREGDELVVGV